jgi:VanZ family protein
MAMGSRTSAWPLAVLYAGLIAYASLYPFTGWRVQGVEPWSWVWAPWPQYWTGFDMWSNFVGYMPLGALLAVAALRLGWRRGAFWWGAAGAMTMSVTVESLQTFLPGRVPSNVDFGLNSFGGLVGAGMMVVLDRWGGLARWSRFRDEWFAPGAHGGLVLLALWPLALLYPASVPFGLGQVADRLMAALADWLWDTPFVVWLPARSEQALPLSLLTQAFCIALSLLAPLMMAFGDMRAWWRRVAFLPLFFGGATLAAGLSSALTHGPSHAWAWLSPVTLVGMGAALLASLLCLPLSRRVCHAVMLLCLGVTLTLLNRAPEVPYLVQSLEVWEQGRFIRFHGLSQWLGWLWPFAAILFGLRAVARPPGRIEGAA